MTARVLAPVALLLATALGASACRESAASANATIETDSAGVTIVESREARWTDGEALVVAAEPLVSIGGEGEGVDYEFGGIADAARLTDGRLAVFDRQAAELRLYDADGRFLARHGGKGKGPGEFQFVSWMARLPGDSLMVHDVMNQRITVLASAGTVGRTVDLAAAAARTPEAPTEGALRMVGFGRYRVVAPLPDGGLLARAEARSGAAEGGLQRDSVAIVRLAADGALLDTLGVFLGDERQSTSGGSGERRFVMTGPPPFGRTAQLAMASDGFYFGANDRYEIGRYGPDGALRRLLRRPVEPQPVTQADLDAQKERELSGSLSGPAGMDMRRMIESKWENAVTPPTMPAFAELQVDATGRLWVRETQPPAARDEPVPWSVFDPEGRLLGAVTMPPRFRVLEIGDDWVLGVYRDELDVEHLRLYPLQHGESAS